MKRFFSNLAMWAFHIGFVRPVLRWGVALRYRRRSLVPQGPCLVVSNHNSHLDAAVLMTLFPLGRLPRVHPVAAADYFGKTWFMRAMAMLFMNGVPIERRPRAGRDPLVPIVELLAEGHSLVFFPEGSRGEAGVVAPFRPGIGRIVKQLPGLLVVPVYLSGPERIWPRGQLVPVPLNIDAIVGKPRSYDPDLDPKAIAEQVQHDVLALAPPPPPVPQPRPAPAIRVAVCGLEERSRSEVFRRLAERLGRVQPAYGISNPVVEADERGIREVTGPIPQPRGRAWVGLLAGLLRTGGLFKGERFVEMVDRAQIDEALGHRPATRFVVTDGSALVDLLAWTRAGFGAAPPDDTALHRWMSYLAGRQRLPYGRWWEFIRKAPEIFLMNVFDLAHPPVPDVLIRVTLSPERHLERVRERGSELRPFETLERLEQLADSYERVGDVLQKRRKVSRFTFNPEQESLEDLLVAVEAECRLRLEAEAAPTDAADREPVAPAGAPTDAGDI